MLNHPPSPQDCQVLQRRQFPVPSKGSLGRLSALDPSGCRPSSPCWAPPPQSYTWSSLHIRTSNAHPVPKPWQLRNSVVPDYFIMPLLGRCFCQREDGSCNRRFTAVASHCSPRPDRGHRGDDRHCRSHAKAIKYNQMKINGPYTILACSTPACHVFFIADEFYHRHN